MLLYHSKLRSPFPYISLNCGLLMMQKIEDILFEDQFYLLYFIEKTVENVDFNSLKSKV